MYILGYYIKWVTTSWTHSNTFLGFASTWANTSAPDAMKMYKPSFQPELSRLVGIINDIFIYLITKYIIFGMRYFSSSKYEEK